MNLKYLLLCLSTFFLASCYDDQGNYDYRDINEIRVIGGIDKEYSVFTGITTMKITPILDFSQDSVPEDRFRYKWYVVNDNFNSHADSINISTQRNLEYKVTLPKASYYLVFTVKDTRTGVEWIEKTILNVTTLFTNGWLLLGDRDGFASLDMVTISTKDTTVVRDVLKDSGLPPLRGPRKMFSVNYQDNNNWPWVNGCFILTDDGTYELDRQTFDTDESMNYRYYMYDSDIKEKFAPSDFAQNGWYNRVMIADSMLYVNPSLSAAGGFGLPVCKYDQYGETFKVWPELMYAKDADGSYSYDAYLLAYNMEAKRFVQFKTSSLFCNNLPDNEGDPFKWETGNDIVAVFNSKYMSGSVATSYVIMKSPDSRYYLYSFTTGASDGTPKKGKRYDITSLPGIGQAKMFVFSGNYPYMLYAVGSQLHACEFLDAAISHKQFDGFGADEITLLHFETTKEADKDVFYIGTYNSTTGGTVQKYKLLDNPDDILIEKVEGSKWNNLGRVTSMTWKWY